MIDTTTTEFTYGTIRSGEMVHAARRWFPVNAARMMGWKPGDDPSAFEQVAALCHRKLSSDDWSDDTTGVNCKVCVREMHPDLPLPVNHIAITS